MKSGSSKSARASCKSSRSKAPVCAAPISRSRSRRWVRAVQLIGYADDPRPPGSIPQCLGADAALADQRAAIRAASADRRPFNPRSRRRCVGCLGRHRRKITDMPRPPGNRFRSAGLVPHPPRRSVCRKIRFHCQTIFQTMPSCRAIVRRQLIHRVPTALRRTRRHSAPTRRRQSTATALVSGASLSDAAAQPAAAWARTQAACRDSRTGNAYAGRDAGVSDRLGARRLGQRWRAAGGDALVRRAGGRDQADLRLFVPRHGRRRRFAVSPSTHSATRSTSPLSRSPTAAGSR